MLSLSVLILLICMCVLTLPLFTLSPHRRVADKKVKYLNRGEYKRLSIAEEMVHGPKLLLMDEPTTGVSLYEASILLLTFREMVSGCMFVNSLIGSCGYRKERRVIYFT